MKGLIFKDLLLVKRNFTKILIFMAVISVVCVKQINILAFIFPFYSVSMCLSTLTYDDYNKWNNFARTLPVNNSEIITSKYLMTGIVVSFVTLLSFMLVIIFEIFSQTLNIIELLSTISGSLISSLLTMSFMYPLFLKFGSEKGRIILFVIIFAVCGCMGFLFNTIGTTNILNFFNGIGLFGIIIGTIIIVLISYYISILIYKNKEF